MPPKPSKKADQKRKDKLVEDKTFGLKNKNKSKNVQKYIAEVTKQVKGPHTRTNAENKKKSKEAMEADLRTLFAAAITQPKIPLGVDPKSIVCEFYKQASCAKGNRCKFSHDLSIGKRSAKIDLYTDNRHAELEKDKMEDWDQKRLEQVIHEKHGELAQYQTDIVCKHFLDAIEKNLYGWFWVCPNGGKKCKYRHALPPGYVFKAKKEREGEKANKVDEKSMEEMIEEQRALLGGSKGTPVNEDTFRQWKADKLARKTEMDERKRKEEAKKSGGRGLNALSGRALFSFDPTLFRDDEEADDDAYSNHSGENIENE